MMDSARAGEAFLEAAELNRTDPLLVGSLLVFPNYGQLVMTGDLHGHRRNYDKLVRYCALGQHGARHVVLHELIHEEITTVDGEDNSHELLLAAAELKRSFPEQVHFLQSNHELAQLQRHEITKNGRVVTVAFEESVARAYPRGYERVIDAIGIFIRSYPLAGRTANRVLVSHSLPSPQELGYFDATVLSRTPTAEDLAPGGAAHLLVWGRYQTSATLEVLRGWLDVDYFICGHQPQESGYEVLHERMVILASDHNHGVFLPLDLGRPVTLESLTRNIRPFAALE
ncbi:MAG: hypothetical protein HY763_00020 [Planctomycetes bacterium]|nr:hypothetical protein [Planctomycetota bacterium]